MSRIAGLRKFFIKTASPSEICKAIVDVQVNLRETKQLNYGSDVNLYHSHLREQLLSMIRVAWGHRLTVDSWQCPWSDDVLAHLYCTIRKATKHNQPVTHEMIDLLELDALVSELPEQDEAKVREALGDILPGGEAA